MSLLKTLVESSWQAGIFSISKFVFLCHGRLISNRDVSCTSENNEKNKQ